MDLADLHLRLAEITPAALAGDDEPEVAAIDRHAAAGCSRCARALVDAREAAVEIAIAEHEPAQLSASLRARVLAARPAPRPPAPRPRYFDPAGEVARHHARDAEDAARVAEIDALVAALPHEDDACEQLLAQMGLIIGFPLMFVSVVRGERVGYRVQRGLDARFAEMRDRRRETTFCTHAISCGGPLVVENAAEEPFFRGSNMVRKFGVHAYVGVPLVTSRGLAIGTLCAMDFRARAIDASVVRVIELFTGPVLAEIERARRPSDARLARTASGAPIHGEAWLRALLDAELVIGRAAGRPSSLVVARDHAALAGVSNVVTARATGGAVACLCAGISADEIARDLGPIAAHVEPRGAHASGASWWAAAVASLARAPA